MFSILSLLFGAFMLVSLAFWALFFLVVKVRIADKALGVQEDPGFGFLITRWPHEEMRAYLASLDAQEAKRPMNQFLRWASLISFGLLCACGLALVIVMVVGMGG